MEVLEGGVGGRDGLEVTRIVGEIGDGVAAVQVVDEQVPLEAGRAVTQGVDAVAGVVLRALEADSG